MTHDPMCPYPSQPLASCEWCALIARVREDSRQVAIVAVENTRLTAYEQGQRDERQRSLLLIADAYAKGQRDERERIRTGVTGLGRWYNALRRAEVLAVIDGGES